MESLIRSPFGSPVLIRKAYGEALVQLGAQRDDVVVLSADVQNSDFSFMFEAAYPHRFINVGIAEPALVDVAVGLANAGKVAIANTFAFLFTTRALEMVRTHVCYGGANVKLAAAYAGLSDSFDGPTHQSISDLAILRSLPKMTIVVPADSLAVRKLLPQVVAWSGPAYFRMCRNELPQIFTECYEPEIGKGITLIDGEDATVIACGVMVCRSIEAAQMLMRKGIRLRVVEMHTVKPLDVELIVRCARETGAIVTAEEHSVIGGLGGAVAECLSQCAPVPMERVGVNDTFAESGPYSELLDKYGLSAHAVVAAVENALERKLASSPHITSEVFE
ncbi:MAG TPA: transketolase C-terminal domain-containing protein [Acidobacteriaceae bacterium]|nr:transketolase C-terminal domain-containing protein [Acidobacteriaceae bacterium]